MTYTARQGDIIWLDFDPQVGHEQKGRRSAVIISNSDFNAYYHGQSAMVCPITSTDRGIGHQIKLDNRTKTTGFVLSDQTKILNIAKRNPQFIEAIPSDLLLELVDIVYSFIYVENQYE